MCMTMRVEYSSLFGPPLPKVIAHGVNARGVMGKGVAAKVKKIFPAAFDDYKRVKLTPGDVHHWHGGEYHVFNLCTQLKPGPGASLLSIAWALEMMVELAGAHPITAIHMPKIGCGLGGLTWDKVGPIVEARARVSGIEFIVHDFDPGGHHGQR